MADELGVASSEYVPNGAETYEEWFDRQVLIGLRDADDPNTVWHTQEEVVASLNKRRQEWLARAEAESKVA
jgi:hypothetical protein